MAFPQNNQQDLCIGFSQDWVPARGIWPVALESDPILRKSFSLLRGKWAEVPFRQYERVLSSDLKNLSDAEILQIWTENFVASSTGDAFSVRGWYQTLYSDALRGKKILDFGCGLAPDGILWAEHVQARLTFVDIVESNVEFVKRVCKIKHLDATFRYLEDLRGLDDLPSDYDVIYCCGSLLHAPLEMARMEAQSLLRHLRIGGRWIELAYPEARWERDGRLAPDMWGAKTDGPTTPWVEWHDLKKVAYLLAPAVFETVLHLEFHGSDFNWFDLIRRA